MKNEEIFEGLAAIVGKDRLSLGDDAIIEATKDYIGFRRYERDDGVFDAPKALCVVKVSDTEQASAVLKFLNENKVKVTPRTGGSSVTMGIEPVAGAVMLDGSEMNEIIEVNETDMQVTARCGTPLQHLENYLNKMGYTTGHSPQSLPLAQLGGLVATRSIGQFSTLYGGIEDLLVGLEAVLPNGDIVRIKNGPRRSVGPDLRSLFLGCEGTLGFITEVTVKIFKYKPEERWMCAYQIDDMQKGLEAIREIMVEGYRPAVIRLHDPLEVELLFNAVTDPGKALLIFLAEGPKSITDATGAAVDAIVQKHGAKSLGVKPVESWVEHRNDVSLELEETSRQLYSMNTCVDTCEISAAWSEIGKIYEAVLQRMPEELENLIAIGGHSSHSYLNGTNIYFQFLFQVREKGTVKEDYMHVIKIIMEETLKRGGSIAHHHGSGKYRTEWMPQEHGSSYELLYKLKEAFDPNGILNEGILLV
ncbi:MAG: FAD-binding oxidoreductase [Oscillospiraceae bacterium]